MISVFATAAFLFFASVVIAKNVVINVGGALKNFTGNWTDLDPTLIFDPQTIEANFGDNLIFNFTFGNFSVIQSTFAEPCIHAHDTNVSINGFDSGTRQTVNGTAITTLNVPVNTNDTIWFYEFTFCGLGGVGGINVKPDSNETFDGFVRNAERLFGPDNGTDSSSSSSSGSSSASRTSSSSNPTQSSGTNGAVNSQAQILRGVKLGFGMGVVGLAVVLL